MMQLYLFLFSLLISILCFLLAIFLSVKTSKVIRKILFLIITAICVWYLGFWGVLSLDNINILGYWKYLLYIGGFLIPSFFIYYVLIRFDKNQQKNFKNELEHILKKKTAKLVNINNNLKNIDDAKSEFLSIASHQLRTPLTITKGYVSMMNEGNFGKVPKIIKDNLVKVYQANERLLNLVENLLDISRIEAGRLQFEIAPVDLVEIVEPMLEDFEAKANDKKIKLGFYPEPHLPECLGDAQKIKEVISNLLDNSIKYTSKGEIMVNIHLESRSLVFSCQDTGMGIEPEDLPRLFNKFVRGKGMVTAHTEGTGLGLYFARVVIENMGGRIWAESPGKGRGSKFSFSLPLANKAKAKKIKAAEFVRV